MFHYIFAVHRKPNTDTSDYQGLGTPDPHPTGHSLFKLGNDHRGTVGVGSDTSDSQVVILLVSVPLTEEDWVPLPEYTILALRHGEVVVPAEY